MNILWFTWKDRRNPISGGAEVVNEQLAKRLAADGHTVTFMVAGFPNSKPQEDREGYRIIRVGSRYTSYLAAFFYYRKHQAELAPDLVIDECNTMPYFAGWYVKAPTILFFHQLCRRTWFHEFPQPLSTIGFLAEPMYLRLLKRTPIITVSQSTKQDLIRRGLGSSAIHIISEGLDMEPLKDLTTVTKFPEPTMLSLGTMRAMKRTLHQVKAFEIAKKTLPNLKLIIAGDSTGSYGHKVLEAVSHSAYASDITYRGRVTPEERQLLMQKAHLITVTSLKEGWGLIVTEANSQGTPAVVYNVDGLRDSVRNGQTGLIAVTNTPASLAAGITDLLSDPARYQALRSHAWQWSKTITFDQSYADFIQVVSATVPNRQTTQDMQAKKQNQEVAVNPSPH